MQRMAKVSFGGLRGGARRADALYEELREQLEREHPEEIVAIEPESGAYFIGKNRREAEKKARAKHPGKILFRRRIGDDPAVIHLPGSVSLTGLL